MVAARGATWDLLAGLPVDRLEHNAERAVADLAEHLVLLHAVVGRSE